jgi:hypothetical protein
MVLGRLALLAVAALSIIASAASAGSLATITGTLRDDVLRGTAGADKMYGRAGNDRLYGYGGSDLLVGGPGRDLLNCGSGRDIARIDAGDTVVGCERVIRASAPKPPPPSPPPPPPQPGETRDNPIPLGTTTRIVSDEGTPWSLTVNAVFPDATAQVLAANMFNDPPKPGYQFFMFTLTLTYLGSGSEKPASVLTWLKAVGASNVAYQQGLEDSCGVLPEPDLDPFREIFSGGSVTGNECFQVRSSDADSLVLYYAPPGQKPVWFALRS